MSSLLAMGTRTVLASVVPVNDRATVGGIEVGAHDGDFYGGWITPDGVGPFKGSPGSRRW